MSIDEKIERFPPVMLYHILAALRRFEPDFYAHLCRRYNLDADRMTGLFAAVEELGGGQLLPILRDLRAHDAYHEILYLAGRNTLLTWVEDQRLRPPLFASLPKRFTTMLKQLLPDFLGHAGYIMMVRGSIHFLEIRDSVFAREAGFNNALCGFYCGLISELATHCGAEHAMVTEARCCASDNEATTCLFQISL